MSETIQLIPPEVKAGVVALLGLIIGSFTNVLIHRLPLERSVVWPGSRCPVCEVPIAWYDNIPVVSWILLGGRCRRCRTRIPVQYPLVEALCSFLMVSLFLQYGLSWRWAALCWLVVSVVALVPIDFRHGILPDRITLPGILAGILFSLVTTEPGLVPALLGAAVGAAIPLLIRAIYLLKRREESGPHEEERREGMGLGDVKMLAMVGAFLGAPAVLLTIILASVIGTLMVVPLLIAGKLTMKHPVPFGPFLGAGAVIAVFWGKALITWYTGMAFSV